MPHCEHTPGSLPHLLEAQPQCAADRPMPFTPSSTSVRSSQPPHPAQGGGVRGHQQRAAWHAQGLVPVPQVRYLKIIEKSGYQALPWVRYITQNGGTCSPCAAGWGCRLRGSLVAEQLPPGWLPLGWHHGHLPPIP